MATSLRICTHFGSGTSKQQRKKNQMMSGNNERSEICHRMMPFAEWLKMKDCTTENDFVKWLMVATFDSAITIRVQYILINMSMFSAGCINAASWLDVSS